MAIIHTVATTKLGPVITLLERVIYVFTQGAEKSIGD